MNQSGLLTCWKEIAMFFGKGVRTVQRWEADGLPIHRPSNDKSLVFADPEELRQWALCRRKRFDPLSVRCKELIAASRDAGQKTRDLIAESRALVGNLRRFELLFPVRERTSMIRPNPESPLSERRAL